MSGGFTKGPWSVEDEDRFCGWPFIPVCAGYVKVCEVQPSTESERIENVDRANAKLLAAAPEMLEALRALVDAPLRYNGNRIEIECADHADAMERVRKARAATTKATP